MLFNSIEYCLFLPAVFFIYWALARPSLDSPRAWFLLAASYFFYAGWNAWYLLLIFGVTVLNFAAALMIGRALGEAPGGEDNNAPRPAKAWLALAAAGSLGALGVFKYYNFFIENVNALLDVLGLGAIAPASSLLLPVGISFYTFQSMSYSIDVYRGRISATRSFRDFALYVAFFPQLVAGPIVRAETLLPQLKSARPFGRDRAGRGLFQILSGLFKKIVLADMLAAAIVDGAFKTPGDNTMLFSWLAVYGYALQIYCDFSGYTDIAIGSARLLGIEIPDNFNRPYLAAGPRDFWRRWHISLSTWLRDYLYISLGGNRKGPSRMYLALFVTMLLGGLWHGANWTFIAWGAYHGVLLMAHRAWSERAGRSSENGNGGEDGDESGTGPARVKARASTFVKGVVTFHLVCLGWVFFRSANMGDAIAMFSDLFAGGLALDMPPAKALALLAVGYALHFTPLSLKQRTVTLFAGLPAPVQGIVLAVALAVFSLAKGSTEPFIYFRF